MGRAQFCIDQGKKCDSIVEIYAPIVDFGLHLWSEGMNGDKSVSQNHP